MSKNKDIIIDSMSFLVQNNRVKIYAFVIMPNHMHLVWKVNNDINPVDVQRDFLKFTSQKIKFDLQDNESKLLKEFHLNSKDRKYQIWERNPLTSRLPNIEIVEQKVNYIHANPIRHKWNLCKEITVLDHGEIICRGSPDVVQKDSKVIEAYLGISTVTEA